jgi:O-antigen ligase
VLLALVARLPQGARAPGALAAALLCFAVPVGLVIAEPWLLQGICRDGAFAVCRPAMRRDTWEVILPLLAERPLFGWGPSYRLGADTVGHAHNGLLGSAFHFGLPMAAGLVAILAHALRRGAGLPAGPIRDFALAGLFFAAGFIGSDLPNPFAFLSSHYLFLWLPVVAAVAASATPELSAGRTPPTGSPTAPR